LQLSPIPNTQTLIKFAKKSKSSPIKWLELRRVL
jgi:hypothetical protein